jgi:D-glycero-D-manno-heptose 1,7-bisphosphate phosphatase
MSGRRAFFLDRDGVINLDHGYVHTAEKFDFVDGIFELCATAQALGYLLIVVTNQAGIGRGYYSEAQLHTLTEWMCARFRERGIEIAKVYFCPDHPLHGIGAYKRDSVMRKPNPGMILAAATEFSLDLAGSVLVGDKESDVAAGRAAGVGRNFLFCGETANVDDSSQLRDLRQLADFLS